MSKVVLVTGATGFIGTRLCQALRARGFIVKTLSRVAVNAQAGEFQMDLANDECPGGLFDGVDTVFHLAGIAHAVAEKREDEILYRQVNADGTRKLLEAAKLAGVKRFVFFSSVKAVGESGLQPMDESVAAPADTGYGQSKFAAEQLVLQGGYVPQPVVIRPSMVYGNTDKGNLSRMIMAVRRGLFPPLPEFHNRRSMVHVDDLVRAAVLAAENAKASGQIYIVTDGQAYSTRQIHDSIRSALSKPPIGWTVPCGLLTVLAKTGDIIGRVIGRRFFFDSAALRKLTGSAWYSSAKIERELGFKPQHTLPQTLPDIVRFLNSN